MLEPLLFYGSSKDKFGDGNVKAPHQDLARNSSPDSLLVSKVFSRIFMPLGVFAMAKSYHRMP